MCLAIPGKIEEILDNNYAIADFGGVKKNICIDFLKDVKVGEYVNVHVGFAINKISEKQAKENLKFIKDAYSGN
jgi:hydrogenase expression/formation protein HypC